MEQRSHASRWMVCVVSTLAMASANAQHGAPARRGPEALMQVEAVQYPAWLDRAGYSVPLTPGTELRASDMLRTGTNARVQLRLAEGSTVKLGENTRFIVEKVEDRGVFRSVMHVIYGAFRFTTGALGIRRNREIDIRVRTITAGLRGTDVWGKSTDARDLVCLLDGQVSVRADEGPPVTLDKPRDFYQRAREGEPKVGSVDEDQVRAWSRETEIEGSGPAARQDGRWVVVASKFYERSKALALSRELRVRGFPAEVVAEAGVQRVEVRGLAGENEARALMAAIRGAPGMAIPSISQEPERRR